MLTNSNLTQIKSLFNKIGKDDEFEIIKFTNVLKYLYFMNIQI